jgi:alkaline phosphatase D
MKVAFTSCFDAVRDAVQPAWDVLAAQQPEHLVLLGDNIYMDYGLGDHLPLGKPELPLAEWTELMYSLYKRQWAVASFQRAVARPTVHAIWDDHDFAWNNSRGAGGKPSHPDFVPDDFRRSSQMLFELYRDALRKKPRDYPANPLAGHAAPQVQRDGIQAHVDLRPGLRLHLLDGRSFRERKGGIFGPKGSLLGAAQRQALEAALLPAPGINLIASGTTLRKDWAKYSDLSWLQQTAATHRLLVLSGDVHDREFRDHGGGLFEATASALANPPGPTAALGHKTGVFGVLDVQPDHLEVALWHEQDVQRQRIDRATWRLAG